MRAYNHRVLKPEEIDPYYREECPEKYPPIPLNQNEWDILDQMEYGGTREMILDWNHLYRHCPQDQIPMPPEEELAKRNWTTDDFVVV